MLWIRRIELGNKGHKPRRCLKADRKFKRRHFLLMPIRLILRLKYLLLVVKQDKTATLVGRSGSGKIDHRELLTRFLQSQQGEDIIRRISSLELTFH